MMIVSSKMAGRRQGFQSPFISMPLWARASLIFYFAFFHFLAPAMVQISPYATNSTSIWLVLAQGLYVALLIFPLVFYRSDYGWLHPLVFPSLLAAVKSVVKAPLQIVDPFFSAPVTFDIATSSSALSLKSLSEADLSDQRVGLTLLYCFALVIYYIAFFWGPRFRVPEWTFHKPSNVQLKCLSIALVCVLICSAFIISRGGLEAQIVAMRGGRSAAFSGYGQFGVIAGFSVLAMLSWFAFDAKAARTPIFWIMLIAVLLNVLAVLGARSSVINPAIMFVMVWWAHSGRARIFPVTMMIFAALMFFGVVGLMRQDYSATTVDWSVLSLERSGEWLENARSETTSRQNEESDLAAFAGTERSGFLFGRTYLGAIFFWVPRAFWADKPRSADAYNMYVNYGGREITDNFETRIWGIPVGAVVEAFWNFHLLGVVLVFGLYGLLHQWLARLVSAYPNAPAVRVVYCMLIVNFMGTSNSFVGSIRQILFLLGLFVVLGVIGKMNKREVLQGVRSR